MIGCAAIRSNPSGRATAKGFSIAHEYAFFVTPGVDPEIGRLERTERQIARYSERDKDGQFEWVNFRKHGGANAAREARQKLFYPIYVSEDRIRVPRLVWNTVKGAWDAAEEPTKGETVVWPINGKGEQKTWKWGAETVRRNLDEFCSHLDEDRKTGVYMKSRLKPEGTLPRTWWDKSTYSATEYGTNLLASILGRSNAFPFPKSVYAVRDCLKVCSLDTGGTVLDPFAGSGTTGHAVVSQNREDGGSRRFILIEMGDYFSTVLLPRIKKVTFTPEWKDGGPVRHATDEEAARSPRIIKYFRLESYEDALNNITVKDAPKTFYDLDDYVLKYMLKRETQDSGTLLQVEKITSPFSYKLDITDGQESRQKNVDLPETFAYLLGLNVKTRRS